MPNVTNRDGDLEGHFMPSRSSSLSSRPLPHAMKLPGYGDKRFMALDPEEHIERTSNYPGATGHDAPLERAMMDPAHGVPAYGGSTDARKEMTQRHRPTAEVWESKKEEAAQPKGLEVPVRHPLTGRLIPDETTGLPKMGRVHGSGLLDSLQSGEDLRSPVHLIVDPEPPEYGWASMLTTPGGQNLRAVEQQDLGGFGHHQPVQWEGHHRVAAAAVEQQRRREAGEENWQINVPFEIHMGTQAAMQAQPGIMQAEAKANRLHASKQRLRNLLFGSGVQSTGRTSASAAPPKPKRKLGGGFGTGTWNSEAY